MKKPASLFALSGKDFIKALFILLITGAISSLVTLLENSAMPTMSEIIGTLKLSGIATISYLGKQFLTNSDNQLLKKEPTIRKK